MAEETATVAEDSAAAEPEKKSGSVLLAVIWSMIGMLFGAGGFAIPILYPGLFAAQTQAESQSEPAPENETLTKAAYIEFDEAVVNLSSDRLNRYLRVQITLMVSDSDKDKVTELVENEKARLKSWLLSYLS
ncbi:MAG: flagellar basal body-associated FliL family protein, partial [Planctomycetota bacterium]